MTVTADGLQRTNDGKLYVTLGSGSTIDSPSFTGTVTQTGADKVLGGELILAQSFAAVTTPADTTEDTLATITIPAGALGANGALRLAMSFSFTNNANNKTIRIRYSGAAGTTLLSSVVTTSQYLSVQGYMGNRNSASSQHSHLVIADVSGAVSRTATAAIDTTASTTLVITGQKATSGDTLQLDSYVVGLLSKA